MADIIVTITEQVANVIELSPSTAIIVETPATQGLPGPIGPTGVSGTVWYNDSGVPSIAIGVDNDYYLNSDNGDIYQRDTDSWDFIFNIASSHARLHAMTSTDDHSAGNYKLFYSDGSGHVQELTHGTADKVLTSNGATSAPSWETAGTASPLTTKGDLYTYSTTNARLPIGTNDYVLTADSAQATGMKWAASSSGFTDPMTTRGDIIYKSSTATTRLPIGTDGQVLTSDGTDIAWEDSAGGTSDKIEEGNSSVEVVDTGTGQINMTIDGTQKVKVGSNQFLFGGSSTSVAIKGILCVCADDWAGISANVASATANHAPLVSTYRTRGTLTVPTSVTDGDRLTQQEHWCYTTGWKQPCNIISQVKGVNGALCGGAINFYSANVSNGSPVITLTIDENRCITPGVDDTSNIGSSSLRWNDIYATNATIQTSDRRAKDYIEPTDLGLDFILNLDPVSYKWKNYSFDETITDFYMDDKGNKLEKEKVITHNKEFNRKHYGMIAQDVVATCSGMDIDTKDFAGIIYDPDTDRYGLRYQEFIAPIVKAIQELNAKVDNLIEKMNKIK